MKYQASKNEIRRLEGDSGVGFCTPSRARYAHKILLAVDYLPSPESNIVREGGKR